MKLLTNQTTNTTGTQEVFTYTYKQNSRPQGQKWITASGTFDGASVSLEIRLQEGPGEWITVDDATFTAANIKQVFLLGEIFEIRGALASAGGSTSVSLEVS